MHPADQGFELVELAQRIQIHAIDGAPLHEALGIGRQGTHAGIRTIGDDQYLVVLEHVRCLQLVGLELFESFPDIRIGISRILQLDHPQRQTIHEQHDVRTAGMVRTLD